MSNTNFTAGAQYDDWKGEIALDDEDINTLTSYLNNKLINGDVIVGIDTFFFGKELKRHGNIDVKVYVKNEQQYSSSYKKIDFSINIVDFFSLFKRVNLVASKKGQLTGKTIDII